MENKNNNELTVINEQEVLGKTFRIYGDFENPLFLAKDIANWIEHSDTSMMVKNIDDDELIMEFNGDQKPAVIKPAKNSDFFYILMPIRNT